MLRLKTLLYLNHKFQAHCQSDHCVCVCVCVCACVYVCVHLSIQRHKLCPLSQKLHKSNDNIGTEFERFLCN